MSNSASVLLIKGYNLNSILDTNTKTVFYLPFNVRFYHINQDTVVASNLTTERDIKDVWSGKY